MKKLIKEYLCTTKYEKIRDNTMLFRTVATVTVMLLCLILMSVSALAFFTSDLNLNPNIATIKAANFETNLSVQITDSQGNPVNISTVTSDYKQHQAYLEAWNEYTVIITKNSLSTAKTGFIVVYSNDSDEVFHTQQLGVDANVLGGETNKIVFKITVTDSTNVIFMSHWGTSSYYAAFNDKSSYYYIANGTNDNILMVVNGITEPPAEPEETPEDTFVEETVNEE